MRIGIFGEVMVTDLSSQTKTAIAKANGAFDDKGINGSQDRFDKRIDLILVGSQEIEYDNLNVLPCDSVLIYDKITGDNTVEMVCKAIEHYVDIYNPDAIIVSREEKSDVVVPLAASRTQTGSFLDCADIRYCKDLGKIVIEKSVYSGNATAHYELNKCCILTLRQGLRAGIDFSLKHVEPSYMEYACECMDLQTRTKEFEPIINDDLSEADLVIVCGHGVGSKKEVGRISRFAKKMGAALGGTKKIVDVGWLPIHKLIGQTGQIIAPKICLVIGASGAMPFVNGIIDSQTIIAINSDSDARIFNYADIGIVGDYSIIFDGLESLIE